MASLVTNGVRKIPFAKTGGSAECWITQWRADPILRKTDTLGGSSKGAQWRFGGKLGHVAIPSV